MDKTRKPEEPQTSREERLSAALRANLARRKAQARARAQQPGADKPAPESEE